MMINRILSVKHKDCCICAYAMAEDIPWKVSKRRLRKVLINRKRLGVSARSLYRYGLRGYTLVEGGSFQTVHEMMGYSKGIVMFYFGSGQGHAVYWDGFKFVDNTLTGGRDIEGKRYIGKYLHDGDCILMALIKKETPIPIKILSFVSSVMIRALEFITGKR